MPNKTQKKQQGSVVIMCGGVMSETDWHKDPWANMMSYYMEDDKFEIYKKLKASKGIADKKSARDWFRRYAISAI